MHRHDAIGGGTIGLMDYVNSQFDRTVTWKDAEWLVKLWDGPFLIKGLQNPEDAKVARDIGATGVVISNHGGRQLDTTPSSFDCIAPMRDAVGNNLELIVDGGVRQGIILSKRWQRAQMPAQLADLIFMAWHPAGKRVWNVRWAY